MRNPEYSSINPNTGDVTYNGSLSLEKGDHSHMPSRTDAYLPGDERGHVNASSLGGVNSRANVVAQHSDVNHGAYLSVEKGERTALQNGATIESEKTAVVNGQVGDRPTTFTVRDSVTYPDGHTESIHHSFTNESYADQSAWNEQAASLPEPFDAPNPGDELRSIYDIESYASLMDETDAMLPSIEDEYASTTCSDLITCDNSPDADCDVIAANADDEDGGVSSDPD